MCVHKSADMKIYYKASCRHKQVSDCLTQNLQGISVTFSCSATKTQILSTKPEAKAAEASLIKYHTHYYKSPYNQSTQKAPQDETKMSDNKQSGTSRLLLMRLSVLRTLSNFGVRHIKQAAPSVKLFKVMTDGRRDTCV